MSVVPTEALPPQNLEAAPFSQAKIRVEKCHRIGHDLKPQDGTPYSRQRVDELRDIEIRSQQGDGGKKSGLEELLIDTRDYQERRFRMIYRSDKGEEVSEEQVMFYKLGKDGQPQWLTLDGQPLALNGDLYNSRLDSRRHNSGETYRASMIPRVDGRGAYTGVVSIIEARAGQSVEKEESQNPILTQPTSPDHAREALAQLAGQKVEADESQIAMKAMAPILEKIQNSGTMGRLGAEVQFTPEELAQIDQLLSGASAKLGQRQELRLLNNIVDSERGDTAFGISLAFGTAIVEDSSVNTPTVIQTDAGPKIKVPPDTFRLFKLQGQVGSAQLLLKKCQSPLDGKSRNEAYGTPAGGFGRLLEAALEVYKI